MSVIKKGLKAFGLFFASALVYGLFPQNTATSWFCFLVSIAIIYLYIKKTKPVVIGVFSGYLLIGIITFVVSGRFAAMINAIQEYFSKTIPKLIEAGQEIIMLCAICFVLYKVFFPGEKYKIKEKFERRQSADEKREYQDYPRCERTDHNYDDSSLKNGSDEYWKINDQAERIYRSRTESRTTDDERRWIRHGNDFADRLREKYGADDSEVERLIGKYYLDRKS